MPQEKLNIFASHCSNDKEILAELKHFFSFHNINFFLAHEDIKPAEDYIYEIKRQLNDCDIFLLYANENSKKSKFCNQEIGWALSMNKPFITIGNNTIEDFAWGLMERSQAITLSSCRSIDYDHSDLGFKILNTAIDLLNIDEKHTLKKISSKIKNLKENSYNGFRIHSPEKMEYSYDNNYGHEHSFDESWINLVPCSYNDYSYKTVFDCFLGKSLQFKIRICYEGQPTSRHTKEEVLGNFLFLNEKFLSVFSMEHQNPNKELVDTIKHLLNDYRLCSHLKSDNFLSSNVVKLSLFRDEKQLFKNMHEAAQSKRSPLRSLTV